MKAIMVMYDSLNRAMLEPYGCDWTKTPSFARLASKSVQFENCYVGSMPCMPARRELHTGRTNFLHRSWGPMEPYDNSMPEILKNSGVYTHLVSDHQHYWEDGGATYHTRYSSWECVRGQEGDPWKALLNIKSAGPNAFTGENTKKATLFDNLAKKDAVNRQFIDCEEKMPQAQTFEKGLEFLQNNHNEDNWFLQIETFDPHEPFFTTQEYKNLYPDTYTGAPADWPPYYFVKEDDETVAHVRNEYAALLSMCDCYLGKVLDFMDAHNMWEDTMLIVNTDHGYLLGEHGWWSKTVMPIYNEIAHTPLFVWDPRIGIQGEKRSSIVQTIDLAPTLLEYFNKELPIEMEGMPLRCVIENDTPIRDYAVFGYHGGQINITDGRYTYMRAPVSISNQPLYDYTLMPTHMRAMFSPSELQSLTLSEPFTFTKKCPLLKIRSQGGMVNPFQYGNKLFCIENDPNQLTELDDIKTELHYIHLLAEYMIKIDAPKEQFERFGIPIGASLSASELLEERKNRIEQFAPPVLKHLKWKGAAGYQFSTLLQFKKAEQETLVTAFEQYAANECSDGIVAEKHIDKFLKMVLQGDMLQMAQYMLALMARSN